MSRAREPRWITRAILVAIQSAQLAEHGGMPGVGDEGIPDSALNRARQKWHYDNDVDIAVLAAAYTFGIAKNHGFVDGNKRASFMAAYAFHGMNGHDFDSDETEVVAMIERVAAGRMTERDLAKWYRKGIV